MNQRRIFMLPWKYTCSFKRAPTDAVARVRVTNDPTATAVTLTEEDIRTRYPWDYEDLISQLRRRYIDFVANKKYYDLRRPLMSDTRYANPRYLEPGNPRSAKKDFYNPNILAEFDKHYTRNQNR